MEFLKSQDPLEGQSQSRFSKSRTRARIMRGSVVVLLLTALGAISVFANPWGRVGGVPPTPIALGVLTAIPLLTAFHRLKYGYVPLPELALAFVGLQFGWADGLVGTNSTVNTSGPWLAGYWFAAGALLGIQALSLLRVNMNLRVGSDQAVGAHHAVPAMVAAASISLIGNAGVPLGTLGGVADGTLLSASIFVLLGRERRPFWRLLAASFLVFGLLERLATGLLASVVKVMLMGYVTSVLVGGVRKRTQLAIATFAALALLSALPFMNAVKGQFRQDSRQRDEVVGRALDFWAMASSEGRYDRDGLEEAWRTALERLNYCDIQRMVMAYYPRQADFTGIGDLLDSVTWVVPRAVWRDKPVYRSGNEFGREIGFLRADDHGTSLNKHMVCEGYIAGGLFGCLVWGFSMAVGTGLFLAVMRRLSMEPGALVIALGAFEVFYWPESDLVSRQSAMIILSVWVAVLARGLALAGDRRRG